MKPIFSRNVDIDKIAFMNWRIDEDADLQNLQNIGDGFLLASIELAKRCLDDNLHKDADILIFPILNNANHGIELYLKVLNLLFDKLLKLEFKIDKTHNIQKLFDNLETKVKEYKGNLSLTDFRKATANLQSYIKEIFANTKPSHKNDKMDFSRYPFTTAHENHFYVTKYGKSYEIDLENLVVRFEEIKIGLEQLSDFLYYNELKQQI